jgi:hypothetical protein
MVEDAHRHRRRWRWRLGVGVLAGSTAIVGGVALAAGFFSQPGAPDDTPLSAIVIATRTGTATIELGPAPVGATNVSLTLTCLTAGTFGYPDGSSMSCTSTDLTQPAIDRTSTEVVPLHAGVPTVTITASPSASWTLHAVYISRVITSWGTNANGQTYGVQNKSGTPDLVAVSFDGGAQHGYVKASDLACASGQSEVHSPTEALAWDAASKDRNVVVPVYKSDGATQIGTFTVGDASDSNAKTVPVSSLYSSCS